MFYFCALLLFSLRLCYAVEIEHPLNERVFVNHETGTSFRFPYDYSMPDQYGQTIVKQQIQWKTEQTKNGPVKRPYAAANIEIEHFSYKRSELPIEQHTATLKELLAQQLQAEPLNDKEYVFYREDPLLPHRAEEWAPAGICGWEGQIGDRYVYIVEHGAQQLSGLIFRGDIAEEERRSISDTFEILAKPDKQLPSTWRCYKSRRKYVYNEAGALEFAVRAKRPKVWKNAWQVETAHFHISALCSPKQLKKYCIHLEGVYAGLQQYLPTERPMHFKFEIHMTQTFKQFLALSDTILGPNNYLHNKNTGGAYGGYFNGQQLATYTFTEKIKNTRLEPYLQLAHEVAHQYTFIGSNYNFSMPGWLNEAIAVIFESGRLNKKDIFVLKPPSSRLRILKRYYKEHGFIGNIQDYAQGTGLSNVHQYAESYAMLHQLLSEKEGQKSLLEFWQGLMAGQNGTKLFYSLFLKERFGEQVEDGMKAWQKDIVSYVLKGRADSILK